MRVAVVGSGVAGISATWLLNEHSEHEVDLYESADYVGGHTHTVPFTRPGTDQESTPVDTGFIVCNPPTYPNFLAFLDQVGVKTSETEMTFSVSRDRGDFEWAGKGLPTVFCQGRNLLNPRVYRMIWDILRFNSLAMSLLDRWEREDRSGKGAERDAGEKLSDEEEVEAHEKEEGSIGDLVKREGLSNAFRDDYLLPMTAAIWSTPPDKCGLDFPAKTLIRFMHNHHLLQIADKPKWLVVKGGSSSYIKPVISKLPPNCLHISTPIVSLKTSTVDRGSKSSPMVTIKTAAGEERVYDHVVMACHADQTLRILKAGGGVTDKEEEILGGFQFEQNSVVLHGDEKLMPIRRQAWSAWNYLTFSTKGDDGRRKANVNAVSLTYCMNLLQHISEEKHGPVLCTLNPPFEPEESKVVGRWDYEHPVYTARSVQCQQMLHQIQNKRGITFVGAWTQYGFHEDGFSSSLRTLNRHLGVQPPFPIRSAQRPLPSSSLSFLLASRLLPLCELARQALAVPFVLLAAGVVLALGVLARVMRVAEGLVPVVGGLRREIEVVRGFWVEEDGREEERRVEVKGNGKAKHD